MSIVVSCSCGQSFRAKAELAGRRVKCPSCGSPLQIPQSAPPPTQAEPDPLGDPLGLGGIDDRSLGAPLPPSTASRPLHSPARSYGARKRKQDWGPILRVSGIAAGIVAGIALLGGVAVALWMFLGAARSPEAVFEKARAAAEQQDWEGFCECLTPESRDQIAGMMAVNTVMIQGFSRMAALAGPERAREAEEKFKPLMDVLSKHGLDEETVKKMNPQGPLRPGRADPERLQQLLAPISDRNQFVADMIRALQSVDSRAQSTPFDADVRLEELTITDDTATGSLVRLKDGTEKRTRIDFQRQGGSWKIALPDMGR
jgi:hypothetical protein